MESPKIICKASLGKELRKVTFPGSPRLTYSVFRSTLASLFNLADFRLQYKDEDGDAILLSSEEELNDALCHLAGDRTDSDTLILRVFLDEATSKADNELREAPQNSGAVEKNASASQDSSDKNDYELPPLDQVFNNFQDIVGNLVTQIGTRVEKEISSGLANFGILDTSEPGVTTSDSHYVRDEAVDEHPTLSKEISNPICNGAAACPTSNSSRASQADSDASIVDSSNGTSSLSSSITTASTAEPGSKYSFNHVSHPDTNCAKRGVPTTIGTDASDKTSSSRSIMTVDTSSSSAEMNTGAFVTVDAAAYDAAVNTSSSTLSPESISAATTDSGVSNPESQDSAGLLRNVHCAICNSCEHVIVGTRHKCINCPDFDLCDGCFQHVATGHPNHTFMTVSKPGDPEIRAPPTSKHVGIRCDSCNLSILGVRFKCGNCRDFDLCGNCEASPFNNHDRNHVFIKLNRPVTEQIPFGVALLPSFYSDTEREPARSRSHCRRRRSKRAPAQDDQENVQQNAQMQRSSVVISPKAAPEASSEILRETSFETSLETSSEISCGTSLETSSEISCEKSMETSSQISCETSSETSSQMFFETSLGASSESSLRSTPSVLKARFVKDVNTPDGTVVAPHTQFQKIWKMCNTGDVSWPESTILQFTGGHSMLAKGINQSEDAPSLPVGAVEPGKYLDVGVDLQAPAEPGRYISYWRLVDGNGNRFGHRVWCDVIVEAPQETSNETPSMTNNGPGFIYRAVAASLADARQSAIDHPQPSAETADYGDSSPILDAMETDDPIPQDNQEDTLFAEELDLLSSMGFNDREFNVQLLLAEGGSVRNVVDALIADTEQGGTQRHRQNY